MKNTQCARSYWSVCLVWKTSNCCLRFLKRRVHQQEKFKITKQHTWTMTHTILLCSSIQKKSTSIFRFEFQLLINSIVQWQILLNCQWINNHPTNARLINCHCHNFNLVLLDFWIHTTTTITICSSEYFSRQTSACTHKRSGST